MGGGRRSFFASHSILSRIANNVSGERLLRLLLRLFSFFSPHDSHRATLDTVLVN